MTIIKVQITSHRDHPIVSVYRPHFRVRGGDIYLGVEFLDSQTLPIQNGVTAIADVRCIHEPAVSYDDLTCGAAFNVMEGPHIVAIGRVIVRV